MTGCGELSLLLPALAQLSQAKRQQNKHRVIMVDPPWIPYPPALHSHGLALDSLLVIRTQSRKESLWACEQVLRGMPGGAMLAWPEHVSFSELRRFQLAAEKGQKAVFLFRNANAISASSPAALRLQLSADDGDLQIRVLKCRGQRPTANIRIRRPQEFRPLMPAMANSNGPGKRSTSSSESQLTSGRPSPYPHQNSRTLS